MNDGNSTQIDQQALEAEVERHSQWLAPLRTEIGRIVVGQTVVLDRLIIGLLTNGHVLLEGMPGLAKTLLVNSLSQAIHCQFRRIQFTPDLLPADLIGTLIYNPREGKFDTKLGPIFSNLILADEINRAPAKVQSALLEAMQERQVTLGDQTYPLSDPFLVMATQNPIEQEGTYQLPEAQLDRFMFKLKVGYPTREQELLIQNRMGTSAPALSVKSVAEAADVIAARNVVNHIYMDERIAAYAVDLVRATREPAEYKIDLTGLIRVGASPRATINITLAAKALAFLNGRAFVTPQDVKDVTADVLRHRVLTSYEAEAEEIDSEKIIEQILGGLPVP